MYMNVSVASLTLLVAVITDQPVIVFSMPIFWALLFNAVFISFHFFRCIQS
jgi:hypothetical protein